MASRNWRIYFNRFADAPQIWSIDEGSHASEINVRELYTEVPLTTHCNMQAEYPEPKAWMEGRGVLEIHNGTASLLSEA